MTNRPALAHTVEEVSDGARAAVAFVVPRMRGVLHEGAFPLSLVAGIWAIAHAPPGTPRASTAVYAATLSACLGVSAVYHRGHWSVPMRRWLRRLDRATIFLLIAGTFTPIAVVALPGWASVATLVAVWSAALGGAVLTSIWTDAPMLVEIGPYLAVGGFGIVMIPRLLAYLGPVAVGLLALGGAVYVLGAVVYAVHRPNPWPRTFGFHEIFHALVVTAAVLQWIVITQWVVPAA